MILVLKAVRVSAKQNKREIRIKPIIIVTLSVRENVHTANISALEVASALNFENIHFEEPQVLPLS